MSEDTIEFGRSSLLFPSGTFDRTVNEQVLELEYSNEKIIDKQTGSQWNIEGKGNIGKNLKENNFND